MNRRNAFCHFSEEDGPRSNLRSASRAHPISTGTKHKIEETTPQLLLERRPHRIRRFLVPLSALLSAPYSRTWLAIACSRCMRYRSTTVLQNDSLGSEQFLSMNSS